MEITELFELEDESLEKQIGETVEDKDFLIAQYIQIMQEQSNLIDRLLKNNGDLLYAMKEQGDQNKILTQHLTKFYQRPN